MPDICLPCECGDHYECDWPCDCAHRCTGCGQAPIVCECDAIHDQRQEPGL